MRGIRGFGRVMASVLVCAVAALVLRAMAPQAPDPEPGHAVFGYTDATGVRLLALNGIEAAQAVALETAVCAEGRAFPIRHLGFQRRSPADNGRQSTGNFDHDEGQLYAIAGAPAKPGDTCLLVPAGYLRRFPIVSNDLAAVELEARRQMSVESVDAFTRDGIARIARDTGRDVTLYWPLHRAATQQVAAVGFTAAGDSLLAGVVLVESGRLSLYDLPASLEKGRADGGCWRVDDDCEFDPAGMDVPVVLGASGAQLIVFTWWGAEGQSIVLWQASGGRLVDMQRAYRYHAPV